MKRRLMFWLLVCLFIVGVVIRILHFPFRASAVMRVIPADAIFMSRHVAPGERVLDVLASGFVDPLFALGGLTEGQPGIEMAHDQGMNWLVQLLGQRYIATGYVTIFDGRPVPAFIAAAWIGGRVTHLARLGYLDDVFPDFTLVRVDKNTRVWSGHFPDLPRAYAHVSFGIYEGVAFGVATDEPLGAAHLYRVMRRQAKSGASALLESHRDMIDAAIPDQVLIRNLLGSSVFVGARFDPSGSLTLQCLIAPILSGQNSGDLSPALSAILPLVDRSASFWVGTTAGRWMQVFGVLPLAVEVRLGAELLFTYALGRQSDKAAVAWVADRAHSGRAMRLRVPAVAFAFEVEPDASATDILAPVLRRLQSDHQISWGHAAYGERGVQVFVPPAESWYGALPDGERLGFAVWDGYGFVHTSAEALDHLLAGFHAHHPVIAPFVLPDAASWYGSIDMPAAAAVLRMGLSSYFLWQALQGHPRDQQWEARLLQMTEVIQGYTLVDAVLRELPDGHGLAEVKLKRDGLE